MAYTKADTIKAVLEDLGVLDRAGTVNATDSARVGVRYDAALASFTAQDVVTIPSNAVPDNLFLPLVSWLVQECAPLFHQPRDLDRAKEALAGLRALARSTATVADTAEARLATRALRALGVIGRTAYPSAKELASVVDRLTVALADLAARFGLYFADADDVESVGATDAMVDYLAALLAPEQENPLPAAARIPTRQDAEQRLRTFATSDPVAVVEAVYY